MWGNFHFLYPAWLGLFALVPVVWVLKSYKIKHKANWEQWIDPQLRPYVLTGQISQLHQGWPVILSFVIAITALAMAGPAWTKREVPVFRNQQAVVLGLDLSQSMQAEDVKPDRLSQARFKLLDLLNTRKAGQTGLVVFAGDAFAVSPLTDDIENISEQVKNLTPEIMPVAGSRLAPAIQQALDLFKQSGVGQGQILLMTDGVSDTEAATAAAEKAQKAGYPLSILAIGTPAGAPIPQRHAGFLTDAAGQTIMATVNIADLQAIAQAGGGKFVASTVDDADINQLTQAWQLSGNMALTDGKGRQIDTWVNQGYWLLLLLIPVAVLAFRRGWLASIVLAAVCLPSLPQPAQAASLEGMWLNTDQRGLKALNEGNAEKAEQLFKDSHWKAAAAYKNKDFKTAEKLYSEDKSATGQYNLGNSLAMQGKLPEAVKAYEQALAQQPEFPDAKANLETVKKALEQQDKQQQAQNNQQNQKSDQQNQQNSQAQSGGMQGDTGQEAQQTEADKEQAQREQQAAEQAKQAADKQAAAAEQLKAAQAKQAEAEKAKQAQAAQAEQTESEAEAQNREQAQAAEQWLRRIPDDPSGLWRRKFVYQYRQRGNQTVEGETAW
jgi:Ca-activated chloride channel family protein